MFIYNIMVKLLIQFKISKRHAVYTDATYVNATNNVDANKTTHNSKRMKQNEMK